jgi:SAM-dependent methyltransferase
MLRKELPRKTVLFRALQLIRPLARIPGVLRILMASHRLRVMNHEPLSGPLARLREYIATSCLSAFGDLNFSNAWRTAYLLREPDRGELQAAILWESMLEAEPAITSVWEIGCGVGSILLYLGKRFPKISFVGTELNPTHVARLNDAFRSRGVDNVLIMEAGKFPDSTGLRMDMICTRGTLYYVAPGPMTDLIERIRAVDPKVLALCEPSYANGPVGWAGWVSNKMSYAYDFGEIFLSLWSEIEVQDLKWAEDKPPGVLLRRGKVLSGWRQAP